MRCGIFVPTGRGLLLLGGYGWILRYGLVRDSQTAMDDGQGDSSSLCSDLMLTSAVQCYQPGCDQQAANPRLGAGAGLGAACRVAALHLPHTKGQLSLGRTNVLLPCTTRPDGRCSVWAQLTLHSSIRRVFVFRTLCVSTADGHATKTMSVVLRSIPEPNRLPRKETADSTFRGHHHISPMAAPQ